MRHSRSTSKRTAKIAGLDFLRFCVFRPEEWCKLRPKSWHFLGGAPLVHNVPRLTSNLASLHWHWLNMKTWNSWNPPEWGLVNRDPETWDMICLSHLNQPFVDHVPSGLPYGFSEHFFLYVYSRTSLHQLRHHRVFDPLYLTQYKNNKSQYIITPLYNYLYHYIPILNIIC